METKEKIDVQTITAGKATPIHELVKGNLTFQQVVALEMIPDEYQTSDTSFTFDGILLPSGKKVVLNFKKDSAIFYEDGKYHTDAIVHIKQPAYIKAGTKVKYPNVEDIVEYKDDRIKGFGIFVKPYEPMDNE